MYKSMKYFHANDDVNEMCICTIEILQSQYHTKVCFMVQHTIICLKQYTSMQIIFVYEQVICQAKDKFWPDKKPVWSDQTGLRHFGISE